MFTDDYSLSKYGEDRREQFLREKEVARLQKSLKDDRPRVLGRLLLSVGRFLISAGRRFNERERYEPVGKLEFHT